MMARGRDIAGNNHRRPGRLYGDKASCAGRAKQLREDGWHRRGAARAQNAGTLRRVDEADGNRRVGKGDGGHMISDTVCLKVYRNCLPSHRPVVEDILQDDPRAMMRPSSGGQSRSDGGAILHHFAIPGHIWHNSVIQRGQNTRARSLCRHETITQSECHTRKKVEGELPIMTNRGTQIYQPSGACAHVREEMR